MKYIVVPTESLNLFDSNELKKLGLENPRISLDGSLAIMHLENYYRLYPAIFVSRYSDLPIYESGAELDALLNSEAWSRSEFLSEV